jgi:hypothetical protein
VSVSLLQAIGISGLVSSVVTGGWQFVNGRSLFSYQLRRQHEQEERKKLRELIGRYQGRILEAALDWDRRMTQLYDGHYDDLRPARDDRLNDDQYYFQSVVFRFLQLTAISRRFEAEAFYIDPKIADDADFDLLRYAKGFLWVMIHADLSPDDGQPAEDHFRSDAFRPLLDVCYAEPRHADGKPVVGEHGKALLPETRSREGELIFDRQRCMALLAHAAELGHAREVDELLGFFYGLRPDEKSDARQRRRWDRLVTLHLLALSFIDRCGYSWHRGDDLQERIDRAVTMLLFPDCLRAELNVWLPKLGLDGQRAARLIQASLAAAARKPGVTDDERAQRVHALVRQSAARIGRSVAAAPAA